MNTALSLCLLAALAALSPAAHAYLDPGTGSMILQMLIAGIVGALFTIKMYWYRLKGFFARLFGKEQAPVAAGESAADDAALEQDRPKTSD